MVKQVLAKFQVSTKAELSSPNLTLVNILLIYFVSFIVFERSLMRSSTSWSDACSLVGAKSALPRLSVVGEASVR